MTHQHPLFFPKVALFWLSKTKTHARVIIADTFLTPNRDTNSTVTVTVAFTAVPAPPRTPRTPSHPQPPPATPSHPQPVWPGPERPSWKGT